MVLRRKVEVVSSDAEEEVLGLEAAEDQLAQAEMILKKKREARKESTEGKEKVKKSKTKKVKTSTGGISTVGPSAPTAPSGPRTDKQQTIDAMFARVQAKKAKGGQREKEKVSGLACPSMLYDRL
jgi:hypothetical protein